MSSDAHPTHHLKILPKHGEGNDGIGRYFLLPGSPGRAKQIAELFDELQEEIIVPRQNNTYLGRIFTKDGTPIDVGVSATGMGPGSTEIIATELIWCGSRRLIRVGTGGSVQFDAVDVGSQVIATGAVRDEMASRHYVSLEYPALAHPDTVLAAERAAFEMGIAGKTFKGIVHTKASLYARAVFQGPRAEANKAYKEEMVRAKVLSSEMEAAALFVLASTMTERSVSLVEEREGGPGAIKAGTIIGIIGGKDSWSTEEEIAAIERETCQYSLETVRQLYAIDHAGGSV